MRVAGGRAGLSVLRAGVCAFALLSGGVEIARSAVVETELVALPLRGMKAEVATLIVGAGDGGALAMAVLALPELAAPSPDGGEERSVPVLFELEGASLLEGAQGLDVEEALLVVELYLYALDGAGAVESFFGRGVRVPMDELGEALYDNGLKLLAAIDLPPGGYTLRFLARESSTGRYALRSLQVEVPGEEPTPPRLSAPLVAEASGGWLLARPADPGAGGGDARPFPHLEREGGERLPTGLAVLPLDSVVPLDLLATGLSGAVEVGAALVAHGDGSRTEIAADLRSRTPLDSGGELERLAVALRIPAEAAVATYRLEMTVGDQDVELDSSLEAVTLPPSEMELVWGQVRHYLAGDVLERRADVTLPRGRRRDRREMDPVAREAYRAVLERLVASGETEAAVAELVRREAELFQEDPSRALERLRGTEVTVARLLGDESDEGLLALLVLHLEAYRAHRSRRNFALATHSRLTATDIAELYVRGDAPEVRTLAAAALICLAGDLTESRLWKQSDLLLERAVQLDSGNVLALLLLATNRERFGDYAGAVDLLRRAVETDPRADEARLRLGVNLARLGRLKDALQTLQRLVQVQAEAWIQVLAYEELGRLLLRQSRFEVAARELRAGISRHPRQQGLYVLLGYVLERLGAPQAGSEVLARMPVDGDGESSPRYRYAQPQTRSLVELRSSLMRNAEVRLPLLAQALAEAEEG